MKNLLLTFCFAAVTLFADSKTVIVYERNGVTYEIVFSQTWDCNTLPDPPQGITVIDCYNFQPPVDITEATIFLEIAIDDLSNATSSPYVGDLKNERRNLEFAIVNFHKVSNAINNTLVVTNPQTKAQTLVADTKVNLAIDRINDATDDIIELVTDVQNNGSINNGDINPIINKISQAQMFFIDAMSIISNSFTVVQGYSVVELIRKDVIEYYLVEPDFTKTLILSIPYSGVRSAEIDGQTGIKNSFEIYPNPTTGIVNLSNQGELYTVKVYDVTGKVVVNQVNISKLDISNLNPGVYYIQLQNESNQTIHRIIKK